MRHHRHRRGVKELGLGLAMFALVAFLVLSHAIELPILGAFMLALCLALGVSGLVFFFGGCIKVGRSRGNQGYAVIAMIALFGLSVPVGVLLAPGGFYLIGLMAVATFVLAPVLAVVPQDGARLRRVHRWSRGHKDHRRHRSHHAR